MRISEYIHQDPLGEAHLEHKRVVGWERFSWLMPEGLPNFWYQALAHFVEKRPYTFWNQTNAVVVLSILEDNPKRSFEALAHWSRRIGSAFDFLLKPVPQELFDGKDQGDTENDIVFIANELHPEYLRRTEHIFANLIVLLWAIRRKGGVNAKLQLPNAVKEITEKENGKYSFLVEGYHRDVRNAVAHGQVVFRGDCIQYGDPGSQVELAFSEFSGLLDSIWRSSVAIAVGLLLFLARHYSDLSTRGDFQLPPSLLGFLVGNTFGRPGMKVTGVVESQPVLVGRQLHTTFSLDSSSKKIAIYDSTRIAARLLDLGARDYERYVFVIDQGRPVTSLAILSPKKLAAMMEDDAHIDSLDEAFDGYDYLRFDEPELVTQARTIRHGVSSMVRETLNVYTQAKTQLIPVREAYRIVATQNKSAPGVARLSVRVVLKDPRKGDNRKLLREIIADVIGRKKRRPLNTAKDPFRRQLPRFRFPDYIAVKVFNEDGSRRWLGSCGWAPKGNLVAEGEKVFSDKHEPVFVPDPEEVWEGIRLRYSMDIEGAMEAAGKIDDLIKEIWRKRLEETDPSE